MSKMMQVFSVMMVMVFTGTATAGVSIDVASAVNADGNNVYTLTAASDGAPITSLGIDLYSCPNSCFGQVHPFGGAIATHLQDGNATFGAVPATVDQDTQALFHSVNDNLLVVSGFEDTQDHFNLNFTGFEPFQSRDILQIVLVNGNRVSGAIGIVAGGEETTISYSCIPEPASLGMLVMGAMAVMRRR